MKTTNLLSKLLTCTLFLLITNFSVNAQSGFIDINSSFDVKITAKSNGSQLLYSQKGGQKLYGNFKDGQLLEVYATEKNGQRLEAEIVRGTKIKDILQKNKNGNNDDNVCGVLVCPKDFGGNIDKCKIYKIDCSKLPPPAKKE